ncbi:accessory gene regulator ArgB-like protein [Anaeromicropila herbilytica]|uniref:Accessory gene regulator B n=1 Tax=Anaeromicropila herbilytica TaxID=2785025 RepID=A0A7R7IEJ5_9FIRM|nr:accessory gene regulator B family protein [Anaeromicropila herbilytica]BCN32778.1 hypothetical protein bsdtb5_40730 [Anaeromicropila herbilytica]
MLDVITNSITSYLISNKAAKEEDRDVYKYGLAILLYNIFLVLFIVVLSFFLHNVIATILFIATLIIMRKYTGGHHANSRVKCFTTTVIIYTLTVIVNNFQNIVPIQALVYGLLMISYVLMLMFAPICGEQIQWSSKRMEYVKKCNRICLLVFIFIIICMSYLNWKTYVNYISIAIIATSCSLVIERLKLREGRKS